MWKHKKNAYFVNFDPVIVTFDTNLIPYPIGNSQGNLMEPFSNSQNFVIWRNDVIMTSKMAIFGPFSPQIAHLIAPMVLWWNFYGKLYHICSKSASNGLKVLRWAICGEKGPKIVILTSIWCHISRWHYLENLKMSPLGSLVNLLWDRASYLC